MFNVHGPRICLQADQLVHREVQSGRPKDALRLQVHLPADRLLTRALHRVQSAATALADRC